MYFPGKNDIMILHAAIQDAVYFEGRKGIADMPNQVIYLMYSTVVKLIVLLTALPLHECAHAWVADKLGDHTARYQGRLTLNPLRHLDPMRAILMLVAGFGWAKPVPINARNFRNPKQGMALSAAAGPLSNLLLAYVCAILYKVTAYAGLGLGDSWMLSSLSDVFYLMMSLNVGLAVFNLLPIPPLDGSRLFTVFLPPRQYFQLMRYERYIQIALFAAIFLGLLNRPLAIIESWVYQGFDFLTGFVDIIARALFL